MLAVYSCIVNDHDLRLVVLAAIICSLASFAAITLLHHVRKSTSHMRHIWLVGAETPSASTCCPDDRQIRSLRELEAILL